MHGYINIHKSSDKYCQYLMHLCNPFLANRACIDVWITLAISHSRVLLGGRMIVYLVNPTKATDHQGSYSHVPCALDIPAPSRWQPYFELNCSFQNIVDQSCLFHGQNAPPFSIDPSKKGSCSRFHFVDQSKEHMSFSSKYLEKINASTDCW